MPRNASCAYANRSLLTAGLCCVGSWSVALAADQDAWYRQEQMRRDKQENRDITYWRERRGMVLSSVVDVHRPMPGLRSARIPDPWRSEVTSEFTSTVDIWNKELGFVIIANGGTTPEKDLARQRLRGEITYSQNFGYRWLTMETNFTFESFGIDPQDEDKNITALVRPEILFTFPLFRQRYHNSSFGLGAGGFLADSSFFNYRESVADGGPYAILGTYRHSYRAGRWMFLGNVDLAVMPGGENKVEGPDGELVTYTYNRFDMRLGLGTAYRLTNSIRAGVLADADFRWWDAQAQEVDEQEEEFDDDSTSQLNIPARFFAEWAAGSDHTFQGSIGMFPFADFDDTDRGADNLIWSASYTALF